MLLFELRLMLGCHFRNKYCFPFPFIISLYWIGEVIHGPPSYSVKPLVTLYKSVLSK